MDASTARAAAPVTLDPPGATYAHLLLNRPLPQQVAEAQPPLPSSATINIQSPSPPQQHGHDMWPTANTNTSALLQFDDEEDAYGEADPEYISSSIG